MTIINDITELLFEMSIKTIKNIIKSSANLTYKLPLLLLDYLFEALE